MIDIPGVNLLINLKEKLTKPLAVVRQKLQGVKSLADKIKNISISPKFNSSGADSFMSKMGGIKNLIVGSAIVGGLAVMGHQVIDTLSQFERFEAVLTNTLGSKSAAKESLNMINQFAAKTPYQVSELTDSFIKLANRGIVATEGQLTNVGDVAAALGKDFGQVTEAIMDINNSERWNEIGIKSHTMGDKVSLTFKGVTHTVARTEAGVLGAIAAFGKMKGVSGVMASVSATTGGQLSNLADSFDMLKLKIGMELKPVIGATIKFIGDLMSNLGPLGETFTKLWSPMSEVFHLVRDIGTELGLFSEDTNAAAATVKFLAGVLNILFWPTKMIYKILGGILTLIRDFIMWVKRFSAAVVSAMSGLSTLFDRVKSGVMSIIQGIKKPLNGLIDYVSGVFNTVVSFIVDKFITVRDFVSGIFSEIGSFIGGVWDSVLGVVDKVVGYIGEKFRSMLDPVVNFLKSMIEKIFSMISSVRAAVGDKAAATFGIDNIEQGMSRIKNAFSDYGNGISDAYNKTDGAKGSAPASLAPGGSGSLVPGDPAGGGKDKIKGSISKVAGESQAHRNITVTIGSFIQGGLQVHSKTINEGLDDIEKKVTDMFIRAVRNFEEAV